MSESRRRSRSQFGPYVREFARIYVQSEKNSREAARKIREAFPQFAKFPDGALQRWARLNTHGFRGEVEAAEVEALNADAAETEKWLRAELKELSERKQALLHREKELMEDSERVRDAVRLTCAINDISAEMEKRHRLLMRLTEAKEDDGVERYRKVILACQRLPRGEL